MRLLFSCTIIIIQFACNDAKKSEISASQILNETIESSTKFIEQKNWETYASLDANLEDPKTRYKTEIWKPHADMIKRLSDSLFGYIQSVKKQTKTDKSSFHLNSLYDTLIHYQSAMLNINERLTKEFKYAVFVSNFKPDTFQCSYNDFEHFFLSATSTEMYEALFNVLENRIRKTENALIWFCYMNTTHHGCGYEKIEPLVVMDKSVVMPNETIEILAGLGQINTKNKTTVYVGGKSITNDDSGIARYKFKASKAKGKYNVPVSIDFIDPSTGEMKTISKTITYTVR